MESNRFKKIRRLRLVKSSWLIGTRVLFLEDTVGKPLVNQGTVGIRDVWFRLLRLVERRKET